MHRCVLQDLQSWLFRSVAQAARALTGLTLLVLETGDWYAKGAPRVLPAGSDGNRWTERMLESLLCQSEERRWDWHLFVHLGIMCICAINQASMACAIHTNVMPASVQGATLRDPSCSIACPLRVQSRQQQHKT